jgi:hypothetical protein
MKKVNKTTRALVGTFQIIYPDFDNNVTAEVLLYKKQGGEFRKLPYNSPPKPICNALNDDIFLIPEFGAASDFPIPTPCPLVNVSFKKKSKISPNLVLFLQKVYTVKGYAPSLNKLPVYLFSSGDYMFETVFRKKRKELVRYQFYGSLINV